MLDILGVLGIGIIVLVILCISAVVQFTRGASGWTRILFPGKKR